MASEKSPPHTPIRVTVQHDDFDLASVYQQLCGQAVNPGAVTLFTGLVRELSQGGQDQALTLEHYPGMTEKALRHIAESAAQRWPLQSLAIIHRVGTLQPGEQIVLVGASSAHRRAAFEAAEFIMDYLKTSAPFWKKQRDGDSSYWVESRESDYTAASRWK